MISVKHYGNTANNAYYNHKILHSTSIKSVLPIQVYWEKHAMSKPSWEEIDFIPQNYEWVENPDWDLVRGARTLNRRYTKLFLPIKRLLLNSKFISNILYHFTRLINKFKLPTKNFLSVFKLTYHIVFGIFYKILDFIKIPSQSKNFNLMYGTNFLLGGRASQFLKNVIIIEHGNLRWTTDKTYLDQNAIIKWKIRVSDAEHLWVTNLDPPSLAQAEILAKGKWAAFPHPYVFAENAPLPRPIFDREHFLRALDADFLVLLPSSQNWKTPHHNKGSDLAFKALSTLREQGLKISVVATSWGLDLAESKLLVRQLGLDNYVFWVPPLPRLQMLALMNQVDLCWDQFVIQGFGGVALRAVEAGVPLISNGLSDEACLLVGSQVPWHMADSHEQIVLSTFKVLDNIREIGLVNARLLCKDNYYSWYEKYHSPDLTRQIQSILFDKILSHDDTPFPPDLWSKLI